MKFDHPRCTKPLLNSESARIRSTRLTTTGSLREFEMRPRRGANSSGGISFCEYLLQRPQRGGERLCRDHSQFLRQPGLVHGANLIEQDQTLSATMSDADPKRRLATRRRHGCDEYCAQMIVHFGRGHHHTRALLPDFTPRSEERRVGEECRSRWWPY